MDFESLEAVSAQLGKALGGDGKKDVTLRISSPGGNGFATLLFIDQIQDMKARNHARIHCVASLMAASAAAILLESPVCDTRAMTDATILLFHGVRSQAGGKTGEIEDELKLLKGLDLMVANMIAPRMRMTPAEYLAWIDRHDQWLTADEALARSAVDEVLASGVLPSIPAVPLPPPPPVVCPPPAAEIARAWLRAHAVAIGWGIQSALVLLALVLAVRKAPAPRKRR